MNHAYPLGPMQWRILHALLDDGGQLSTHDVMEALGTEDRVSVWRRLDALRRRSLVTCETVPAREPGRGHQVSLWAIRAVDR